MDAEGLERLGGSCGGFQLVEGVGLGEGEDSSLRAAKAAEVRAAVERLTDFMRDGADIAAGADAHGEGCLGVLKSGDLEVRDKDLCRLEFDGFAFARELVGRVCRRSFLAEKGGGTWLRLAEEAGGRGTHEFESDGWTDFRPEVGAGWLPFGVIGVGRKTEADGSGVALFGG